MYNWEGCPAVLFNLYIEVGDIKKSKFESDDYVFIEVWISSYFTSSRDCAKEECKDPKRRPIYDVLKQIKELRGEKPAVIVFMCDDGKFETIRWSEAILLLHQELKTRNIIKHSVLYTNDSKEETENFVKNANWHSKKTGEKALRLPQILSAVVYGKSNCYAKSENVYVYSKNKELPDEVKNYVQFNHKYL